MTGQLCILILVFGCLIGVPGLIRGQTLTCKLPSLVGPVCKALPNQPIIHHCRRWEKEADKPAKLSYLCCPDAECGDPHEYDQLTCTLPRCYTIKKEDTCSYDFYVNKNQEKQLPAGVFSVGECCKKDDYGDKTRAECCIEFDEVPECRSYKADSCEDADWA